MSTRGQVSQDEAKNFKVSRFIHGRHGCVILGMDTLSEDKWVHVHRPVPKSFLGFKWDKLMLVAILHLEKSDNWIMNVYGRSLYNGECKALAEELAKEFDTHVHMKLIQEHVGYTQPSYD